MSPGTPPQHRLRRQTVHSLQPRQGCHTPHSSSCLQQTCTCHESVLKARANDFTVAHWPFTEFTETCSILDGVTMPWQMQRMGYLPHSFRIAWARRMWCHQGCKHMGKGVRTAWKENAVKGSHEAGSYRGCHPQSPLAPCLCSAPPPTQSHKSFSPDCSFYILG